MDRVSWEECKAKSLELMETATAFDERMELDFTTRQGVYVFVYCGSQLGGSLWGEPTPRIVYVGHTGPDSLRHWRSDTGVSSVRRSLAAMLAGSLHLNAVPKSDDPEVDDRFSNYKLDEASELALTAWMRDNIAIAFFDLNADEEAAWYQALLDYNTPMFVFQNNPNNSYGAQIKLYRMQLAEQAAHAGR